MLKSRQSQTFREKGAESGGSFDERAELPRDEPAESSALFLINQQRLLKERR